MRQQSSRTVRRLISFATSSLLQAALVVTVSAQDRPEDRVVRLEVTPTIINIRVGERARLEIRALDDAGVHVDGAEAPVWSIGASAWYDPSTSEVVGLVPGEETLVARVRRAKSGEPGFDDLYGQVKVFVSPAAVARIEVLDPARPLYAGTRVGLSAIAFSEHQRREDVQVQWSSSNPQVIRVSPNGIAHAGEPGSARITARAEGIAAGIDVQVVKNPVHVLRLEPAEAQARVGDVLDFVALAEQASGDAIEDPIIEWSVAGLSDGAAAYIDDEGTFVAYEPGLYRIIAAIGTLSAAAEVSATPRPHRREMELVAHGVVPSGQATTDLWVFEGVNGRDYVYTGTYSGNLMYAWDVTDPSSPVITDSLAFDGRRVNDVKINADATIAIVTSENASNRRNGITVVDINDPAHPAKLQHFTENLTGGVHNTWIEDDLVYAVNYGTQDLHIIDISDPTAPRTVGRWGLDKENKWLHDVTVKDGLAYLSYWNDGLIILDVGAGIAGGTPTQPTMVSQFNYQYQLGPETYGNTHHAIRYGDYVFVGDEIFNCAECINGPRGYVHVIDVSDIRRPRQVAYYRVPEAGVHNLWAEDDMLYVAYYQAGLRILDISGVLRGDLYQQRREIAWFMTEDDQGTRPGSTDAWGPQPYKGKIFVSDGSSGLWIVELKPPRHELVP